MDSRSPAAAAGWALANVVKVVILLVLELVTTMAVYIYLNLYHIETFGWLVRLSRSVLTTMSGLLDTWFKGSADSAYATLFGELGPKSILLLLLGLVIAALFRILASGIARLFTRRETPELGPQSFRRGN